LDTTEVHNYRDTSRPAPKRGGLKLLPAILFAGLALAVSGCALSMNEFAQNRELQGPAEPVALTGTPEFDTAPGAPPPTAEGLAAQAAAVADSPTALAPTASATQAAGQSSGFPNINAAPQQSNSKLLTPEEKARVIAELEALARGQGASAPAAKATSTECDPDAAQNLDPADRLNSDPAGGGC
jgi:hypothetical protein